MYLTPCRYCLHHGHFSIFQRYAFFQTETAPCHAHAYREGNFFPFGLQTAFQTIGVCDHFLFRMVYGFQFRANDCRHIQIPCFSVVIHCRTDFAFIDSQFHICPCLGGDAAAFNESMERDFRFHSHRHTVFLCAVNGCQPQIPSHCHFSVHGTDVCIGKGQYLMEHFPDVGLVCPQ